MTPKPLVVVVTGSECTGKTRLAADLGRDFEAPVSAEYVREYLDAKSTPLGADDVSPIAAGQLRGEDAAFASASHLVIKDTDLISTVVYSRHYYGECPVWITTAAKERLADLYLLLRPDVPWLADGLQRDRPDDRDHMHELFRRQLEASGALIVGVSGTWDTRRETAIASITRALQRNTALTP